MTVWQATQGWPLQSTMPSNTIVQTNLACVTICAKANLSLHSKRKYTWPLAVRGIFSCTSRQLKLEVYVYNISPVLTVVLVPRKLFPILCARKSRRRRWNLSVEVTMALRNRLAALTCALLPSSAAPSSFLATRLDLARAQDSPSIEPYQYLNGGAFNGPTNPLSPDPLLTYRWGTGVNTSALQIYDMLPISVSVTPGTPSSSFTNLQSLVNADGNASVTVNGAGGFMVDIGVESASWLEFDSPDLLAADLANIQLSVSEWTEEYIGKILVPKQYNTTYRLETNDQLYEGVRFGFFFMKAPPSQPFTISAVRAVSQAKPVNYTGSFSASGDDLLTQIWYTAAYTVRLNLEADYFAAILMDRGDRISWTGDAHVAQSASMIAFSNYPFVLSNLMRTATDCNGIASYCLYWVLSTIEYWRESGDNATLLALQSNIDAKLETAQSLWDNPTGLSFFGWDDRVGAGFANASTTESQFAYRFLSMRAWSEWASAMSAVGNATAAGHFQAYYDQAVTAVRSNWGAEWYALLGIHAASDAINAGFATPTEVAAMMAGQLNNAVTLCSLSNFNQYWILQALGNGGDLDKAVYSIHRCWGDEIALGGTSFWEISHPDWVLNLRKSQPLPYGYNGQTSLCHPWSAGPTSWLTRNVLGVKAAEAGFTRVIIRPHITEAMDGVSGDASTPHGPITVHVTRTDIHVQLPAGCINGAELQLTEVLLQRLGWTARKSGADSLPSVRISQPDGTAVVQPLSWHVGASATGPMMMTSAGADATLVRSRVAVLQLQPGATVITLVPALGLEAVYAPTTTTATTAAATDSAASPFPPLSWPARVMAVDFWTQGQWIGRYGAAGYYLPDFTADGQDLTSLPPFIASLVPMDGQRNQWTEPAPASDPRALQDPRSGGNSNSTQYPSAIGAVYNFMTTAVDIWMDESAEGNVWYQVAVYICDYDWDVPTHQGLPPRRATIAALDRHTLDPVAPIQYADSYENGIWYVFQYNKSMRLRFSQFEGDNAVVSALMFDVVQ